MMGSSQGFSLSVLEYNVHLFGRTALYTHGGAPQETGFYYRDEERLPQLIDGLKRSDADVIGLTEVWDEGMAREIRESLKGEYPYQAGSPAAAGIGRAIGDFQERWPRLASLFFGPSGGVVNYFTKSHYTPAKPSFLSEVGSFLSEDLFVRGLSRWLRSDPVWGAGLLFLSRYPIVSSAFHPHPQRAEWEMLAEKGVLEATVQAERGIEVTLSLGHYQEGQSTRAAFARSEQIRRARERTLPDHRPLIHFGDFNVAAGSSEYRAMNRVLSLEDVVAGDTYLEPNPYQDKLQAPRSQRVRGQRIDYIFHTDDLMVESARVLRKEFRSRDGSYDLSDHLPLWARLFLRPMASIHVLPSAFPMRPSFEPQAAAAAF